MYRDSSEGVIYYTERDRNNYAVIRKPSNRNDIE